MPVRFEFRVTKWPPNDLKWPIVTCKHNFVTQSHFGACYMSFHRFFFNAESIVPIIFEFWVTKWPPNDLKWPILTSHHLRSFWGHLVTWNLSAIESAFQNTYEKTCGKPKREIWPKNLLWCQYWSLEVIWRSFGDSKLKYYWHNWLSVKKNLWKGI